MSSPPANLVGISCIPEYIRNKQMLLLIWQYVPITHSCTANTNVDIFIWQAALLSCGNSSPEYWNSVTFAFSISHTCAWCYEPVITRNLNLSVLYCARFKILIGLLLKIHAFCCCVTGWDIPKILKDHNAFIFRLKQLECEWPFQFIVFYYIKKSKRLLGNYPHFSHTCQIFSGKSYSQT